MAKEEKKHPWHPDKIEKTIEKRRGDRINLLNTIAAMDAQFQLETSKIIKKYTKGEGDPDWSVLDEESKNYNKDAAKEVRELVDKTYTIDSEFSPIKRIVDKAKLKHEDNYFHEQIIRGMYFSHSEDLKRRVGEGDYFAVIADETGKNRKRMAQITAQQVTADIDEDEHGEGLVKYLKSQYSFDDAKVDTERLKTTGLKETLTAIVLGQNLNKDYFHRNFKKYDKGKKKE